MRPSARGLSRGSDHEHPQAASVGNSDHEILALPDHTISTETRQEKLF